MSKRLRRRRHEAVRAERGRRVRDASTLGFEQRQSAAPRVLDLAAVRVDVLVVAGVLLASHAESSSHRELLGGSGAAL